MATVYIFLIWLSPIFLDLGESGPNLNENRPNLTAIRPVGGEANFDLTESTCFSRSSSVILPSTPSTTVVQESFVGNVGFQDTLLRVLGKINNQNNEILSYIRENKQIQLTLPGTLPANIPVKFPVSSQEELDQLENFLRTESELDALVRYI